MMLRQDTPMSPGPAELSHVPGRPGGSGSVGRGALYKQTQLPVRVGAVRFFPRPSGLWPPSRGRTNKPNPDGPDGGRRGSDCAKQTQFAVGWRRRGPGRVPLAAAPGPEMRRTKPIWLGRKGGVNTLKKRGYGEFGWRSAATKQSRFPPVPGQTEAWETMELHKRTQFRSGRTRDYGGSFPGL